MASSKTRALITSFSDHLSRPTATIVRPQMAARAQAQRVLSGTVVTGRNEAVAGATISVRASAGELTATSDSEGNFKLAVPAGALIVKITGKNL